MFVYYGWRRTARGTQCPIWVREMKINNNKWVFTFKIEAAVQQLNNGYATKGKEYFSHHICAPHSKCIVSVLVIRNDETIYTHNVHAQE